MVSKGESTRDRILQATQGLILENGFSATSIDKVLERTRLTKGAFFYHFKNKDALTNAVIERYVQSEHEQLTGTFHRAGRLSDDPLQQLLIMVGLLIEGSEHAMRQAETLNPGCLFGSYAYELPAATEEGRALMRAAAEDWRKMLRDKLDEVVQRYPPRAEVDLDALADGLLVAFEGGLVLARLLGDRERSLDHLKLYRTQLELLFLPGEGNAGGA
jgi:TetR/AcrR family transcriptional regulator, transcriptional repressor for nem operon